MMCKRTDDMNSG